MSVLVLATGGAVALATALSTRSVQPLPRRLAALVPDRRHRRSPGIARLEEVPVRLGRSVRGLLGRPPETVADRRLGTLAIAVFTGALVHPAVAVGVAVLAWAVPLARSRRDTKIRASEVRDQLPDVVDLFRLAIGAGLTVRLAIDAVASSSEGLFADRLAEVQRRVMLGQRLVDALEALSDLGEPARPLTSALVASERDGAPLGPSLERVAADARMLRRRAAEEDARRLPVQLLFPLVACILPAFFLLAVVPLLGGALGSLGL